MMGVVTGTPYVTKKVGLLAYPTEYSVALPLVRVVRRVLVISSSVGYLLGLAEASLNIKFEKC